MLPNLGGSFGMYLGLTGNRIGYGDALWSGLATHTVAAEYLTGLLEEIAESGDPGTDLREVFRAAPPQDRRGLASRHRQALLAGLAPRHRHQPGTRRQNGQVRRRYARHHADQARRPACNVTFRAITAGSTLSMDECMRMEFRILNRMLAGHDFYEGIRAAIIEKGSVPQWRPARLEDVDPAAIEGYFAPLPGGDLVL